MAATKTIAAAASPYRPKHGHGTENPKHGHHGHELLVFLGADAHERGCHGLILNRRSPSMIEVSLRRIWSLVTKYQTALRSRSR